MKRYSDIYTCDHKGSNEEHLCSAGYVPEDTRCPVHPQWHQVIAKLLGSAGLLGVQPTATI